MASSRSLAAESPAVGVVLGGKATPLERLAANQLQKMIERVCGANVSVHTGRAPEVDLRVLVGTRESNGLLADAMQDLPALTEQTVFVRRIGDDLVVAGGSPPAVFWAVHELGYRTGIRQLLTGDVYPAEMVPIDQMGSEAVLLDPTYLSRAWTLMDDRVDGAESLSLEEKQGLLLQLAKLKFNRVVLSVSPWQPFVRYRWQGVKKQTAWLARGHRYEIGRDAPGRTALGDSTEFRNPDFAKATTFDERTKVGVEHMLRLIGESQRLGMSTTLTMALWEAPLEFADKLPSDSGPLVARPNVTVGFDDRDWLAFTKARTRAYVKTYPGIDTIAYRVPVDQIGNPSSAWKWLTDQVGEDMQEARASADPMLNASVVSLAFLSELLQDESVFLRPDGTRVKVAVQGVDSKLLGWMGRLLPQSVVASVPASRVTAADAADVRKPRDADGIGSAQLLLTLADPVAGVFPQSSVRSAGRAIEALRGQAYQGYVVEASSLAEIEPSVQYLARVTWDANTSVRQSHDALFEAITGKNSVADRLWLGFGHIETATDLIVKHEPAFPRLGETNFSEVYRPGDVPEWVSLATDAYTEAMVEMYRSNGNSRPIARPQIFYWAKRGEYVGALLAAVKAMKLASTAEAQGDTELAVEQMEIAMEQLYNAIDSLGDVARNSSDRGTIARLVVHAYQPLLDAYEALLDEH